MRSWALLLSSCVLLLTSGCWYLVPPVPGDGDAGADFIVDEADAGREPGDGGVVRGLDRANCTWNGKRLYGRIRYVDSFPDVRVRVVTALPRLRVREVSSLPNECGEWQIVTSFPDLKVQLVDGLQDLTIEYVTAFPGLR